MSFVKRKIHECRVESKTGIFVESKTGIRETLFMDDSGAANSGIVREQDGGTDPMIRLVQNNRVGAINMAA